MIYECLKENNDDVLFCDRTGNVISVYLKGEVKVVFYFPSTSIAQRRYRKFRKELEGVYV